MNKKILEDKFREVSSKTSDLAVKLQNAVISDDFKPEDVASIKNDLAAAKKQRDDLDGLLKDFKEPENKNEGEEPKDDKKVNILDNSKEAKKAAAVEKAKKAINFFVHGKGKAVDDASGVTSTTVSPLIPEEIIYNPQAEVNSVVDLSALVTKTPVNTEKGTYPILKRADDTFPSVAELKDNPDLATPEFNDVDWSVDTHRGAIAISQESIDDSQVDLTGLIGQNIGEKRVNTFNADISAVLKAFTAKTATFGSDTSVDDIKHILNVDLDPAYNPSIVASQSFFNALDTLKDKNGQYVFHQDVTSASKGTLLGVPVYKVGDALLGSKGDMKAFIGDLSRAVLFADRKEVNLAWQYSPIYGQYLAAVLRYGVSAADAN
ncbi:capsid protein, partial [Oenococcus oeni]